MEPGDMKDVGALIPDVYYDLIARVIPGATFATEAVILCEPTRSYVAQHTTKPADLGLITVCLLMFLGIGYTIGLLTTPIGDLLRISLYTRLMWHKATADQPDLTKKLEQKFGYSPSLNAQQLDFCYRRLHEYVRSTGLPRTVVVSKMQAESALATNLFASTLVLLTVKLATGWAVASLFLYAKYHWIELLIISGTVASSLYAAIERNVRLLQRHFIFF